MSSSSNSKDKFKFLSITISLITTIFILIYFKVEMSRNVFFLLIALMSAIIVFIVVQLKTIPIENLGYPGFFTIKKIELPWVVLIPVLLLLIGFINPLNLFPDTISFKFNSQVNRETQVSPKTKLFGFGYAGDASAISQGIIYKYCSNLEKYLEEKTEYHFESIIIPYTKRFEKIEDNLSIYCDANTITPNRIKKIKENQGEFSEPFFTTGAAIMIQLEKNSNLKNKKDVLLFNENSNSLFKGQKLGVLKNTTTNSLIKEIYPSLELEKDIEIKEFDEVGSLYHSLHQNEITGYITDEIILKDFLIKNQSTESCYKIFPNNHWLSYEKYGIVIYDSNEEIRNDLKQKVNDWLKEKPFTETPEYKQYIKSTDSSC